jgi:hypothetical protein
MKRSVIYMSRAEYMAHRSGMITEMTDAALEIHYQHGAPIDEINSIRPSLEAVIGRWWDSLNTYRDPKKRIARLRDWLEMFPSVLH